MTFTVVYLQAASNHLATIWMNAPDRMAVTQAANALDVSLRNDPYACSQVFGDNSRIVVQHPLAMGFDVSDADCLVTVWAVWLLNS